MSKDKAKPEEPKQSAELGKLLLEGSIILTAPTRDELNEKATALISEAKDQHICAGAVGRRDSGEYTLRLDII